MNTRRSTSGKRPTICATSIAAFLAAAGVTPGTVFDVDLGNQQNSGVISGADNVQKLGYGTLFLDPTSSYTGGTVIDLGAIVVTNATSLGGPVVVNGNVTTGQGGGQLLVGGTNAAQNFAFPAIALAGGGPSGNGLALMSVGNNTLSGGITTSGTVTTRLGSTFGMLTVNGLTLGTGQTTIANSNSIANITLTGLSGTGTLQKQGTSTLVLTGANANTGIVDLNGGFVRVSSASNLGTSSAANAINFNNATLEVRTDAPDFNTKGVSLATNNGTMNLDRLPGGTGMARNVTFANLTLAANRNITFNSRNGYGVQFGTGVGGAAGQNTITNAGNGPVIFTGNVWNNNDGTARVLTIAGAGDTVIGGSITAPNTTSHNLSKVGAGTLTINGVGSTYSGQTDVQNGTVTVRTLRSIGTNTVGANILLGNAANTGTLNFIGAAGSGAIPITAASVARNIILNGTTGGGRINANQVGSAPTALVLNGNITSSNTGTQAKTLTLGGASGLDNELSGVISANTADTVNLTKVDAGVWVLSGANTYNGATTVAGGTLKLRANGVPSTVVNDASGLTFAVEAATQSAGGTLQFDGQAAAGNIETMGVLTPTAGAGTIRLNPGAGGTSSMVFSSLAGTTASIPSSLNIIAPTAADTVTITAQPTGFVRANVYYNGGDFAYSAAGVLRAPLYGDGIGGALTDIGFVTTAAGPLSAGLHNEITGSFAQGPTTINSLKIAGGQTLTLSGLLGIQNGSSTAGGIVLSGAGAATITGGSISQGAGALVNGGGSMVIRVDNPAASLTLESPITNSTAGGVTKNGAGTLILASNAHAYGGGNTINEGTLRLLGTATVMGAANGALVVRQGGTLDLNAVSTGTRIGTFNGSGTITNTGSAAAVLTVGNNNGAGTFTGPILEGSGISVVKQGTAAQTWSGANTYTGPVTINSTGIVSIPNLANIGVASGLGAGNAASDATNAGSLIFGGASVTGATGGISYTGAGSISVNRLFTLGGTANGAGGRIQANGANGAVVIFNNTAPVLYTAGGNAVAQTLTLGGASTGDNQMNVQLIDPSGGGSAVLGVQKADAGTWVLGNTANSYTGSTMISGGRLVAADGLSLPTGSPLVLANGVFQSNGSFTRAVNAAPAPGTGGVHWSATQGAVGGGFAADSSKLTVNLGPSVAQVWGSGGFLSNTGSAAASGVLIMNSTTALAEVELQNAIDLGAVNRTIQVDDNGTTTTDFVTLSGVLSGTGAGTGASGIVKTGAGALQLLGASTYTGATTITAGSLVVQSVGGLASTSSNLGAGAAVLRLQGGTVVYAGTGETSDRAIALNAGTVLDAGGSGALILNGAVTVPGTAARTLTLQGINTDANEIASVIPNVETPTALTSVTKSGAGVWILSGANTYGGTTTVSAGALGIGNAAALGTGTLTVTNGSIFADGADRTISNLLNLNNATGAVIGVNNLTFGNAQFNGGTYTLNNFLPAGKQFEITGTLTNSDAGTARTFALGGTGLTFLSGTVQEVSTSAAALTVNSGTVVLRSPTGNTYSGATTFNGGTVQLAGASGNLIPNGVGKGNVTVGNTVIPFVLDMNGQTETINGLTGTTTGAKSIDNTSASAAALTIGDNNGPVNFNGGITNSGGGALSITKTGSAAGTLSGSTLSYTGTTSVLGGSLAFPNGTPTTTTGITVAGGSGISFMNGAGVPISSLALLNLGGAATTTTIGLDLGPTSDTLTSSGVSVTAGNINFDIVGLAGFGAGTYNLLAAVGGGLLGPIYGLSSVPGGFSYTINETANLISLTATVLPAATFVWVGDIDNSWSSFNAGNTNWEDLAGVNRTSTPGPLDTVTFSSVIAATVPTVTALDGNYTINNLVFNGTPLVGTASPTIAITPGAPVTNLLTIAPTNPTDGISIPDNAGVASITAPLATGTDQTWNVGSLGSPAPLLVVTGPMSGTGSVTKIGLGTANLTNATSTRTGRMIIQLGTIGITSEGALGANPGAPVANQLTLDGGELQFNAATLIDDANRGILLTANNGTFDTATGLSTIANVIDGPGGFTKAGAQTLVLTAANTYGGGTTISAGILRVGNVAALSGSTVTMNGSGTVLELTDGLALGNAIIIDDNANEKTLRLLAGATSGTISSPITVNETSAGNFRVSAGAGGTLTITSNITTTAPANSGIRKEGLGTVVLNPSVANALRGPSSIAAGILMHGANNVLPSTTAVTVHGTGGVAATLDLNGFNQSTGGITFNAGGGAAGSVNSVITGAGTLTLGGNVTVNANGNPTTPALLSGNVAIAATRTFTVANSTGSVTDLLVSAAISSTGTVASGITKAGVGTMVLSNPLNSYAGTTTVNNGTLQNGASNVIPGAVVVNATATSATAIYDTAGFNESITTLTFGGSTLANTTNNVTTGAGTLTLGGNVTTNSVGAGGPAVANISGNLDLGAATRNFTVADTTNASADLLISAIISGAGVGITKEGPGTMELTPASVSTYNGPTTVNAGILRVNGSISGSTVTVNAAGTLGGTGTTGPVTVNGGTVDPGASIGTLRSSSLTMAGTSTFKLEINTTALTTDLLQLTGNFSLDLGNTSALTIADLGADVALGLGQKFTFITYGGTWNGGLFTFGGSPVADDTQIAFGSNIYTLDYNDVGGTAVSLVAVPEPGIAASLLGGFGMLVGLQRIRRRNDRRS